MGFEEVTIQNISGHQEIRIPDSLKINDDKVYVKKQGNIIYIIPFHAPWKNLFEGLEGFSADFLSERQQPIDNTRPSFD